MADAEPLSIRGIHWRDALPFTHLFRAFRVAIHPSKLGLALAALLLLYVGGHVLDYGWFLVAPTDRAVPDEVRLYERFSRTRPADGTTFADLRRTARLGIEESYIQRLVGDGIETDPAKAAADARTGRRLGDVKAYIVRQRQARVDAATAARDAADRADPGNRPAHEAVWQADVRAAYDRASTDYQSAARIGNDGLFDAFFEYEAVQLTNLVQGVRQWNWFGSPAGDAADAPPPVVATNPLGITPVPDAMVAGNGLGLPVVASPGIIPSVERFFAVGPVWLLTQHWVYFTLFGLWFLLIWSVFGGAICRIAAVHVARDEKLSVRSALVFSVGKFLSFLCAPLIPLGLLVVIGLLTALASLVLTGITWLGIGPNLGAVVMGLGFFLALLAGLAMAVLLVGLVGGFNLMYPTVAVEGSDSFDAISRSFSYLYARPWRLAVYTAISVVYGSACYLFVRLFIYLVLTLTYTFVGLGVVSHAHSTAPLLSALWPNPATAGRLSYSVDPLGLTFLQDVAAGLIWFWVHLLIAVLGAFAISFYFSSNTIVYYLLRREVDATDMDDVYVDPADEDDLAEPDPAAEPPTPAPRSAAAKAAAKELPDGPSITAPTADGPDPAPPS